MKHSVELLFGFVGGGSDSQYRYSEVPSTERNIQDCRLKHFARSSVIPSSACIRIEGGGLLPSDLSVSCEISPLTRIVPYRKPDRIIHTRTLDKVRNRLSRKDLINRLDSYFCHTINALENSMNRLKQNSSACIFVGNPRIVGITVEIWRILTEYFSERGYTFEKVYEDRIKTRQLFGTRKNKNPEGMKSEYLLILKK